MTQCQHDHGGGAGNAHSHAPGYGHSHANADGRRLIAALAVISVFMVVEFVGGLLSGSLALIADASHMMTDAIALGLAASAQWLSLRPADRQLHFGYRRFQVLAAFVNGIALVLLMTWIVWEAIRRSINPVEVEWRTMLIIAVLGLVANVIAFRLLHGSSTQNINVRGAMLHVIGDLLGSVAAVVAAVVIAASGWTRIDPLLSILVAALIGFSAYRLLRETAHILLEGAPKGIDSAEVARELAVVSSDIEDVHSVQLWQLTPDHPQATLHVRLRAGAAGHDTLSLVKARLAERFGIKESTIQIETGGCCDGKEPWRHDDEHAHDHAHERETFRPSRAGRLRIV
ncbi:MAG TPA: cation transporter [Parvularcula sp.]|nr:cation transporter [Parvularcula sp.]HBS33076.1 cation transporter [Parvularcula sp.]HBS36433.1 cation transporter [Parvularcula sp.]